MLSKFLQEHIDVFYETLLEYQIEVGRTFFNQKNIKTQKFVSIYWNTTFRLTLGKNGVEDRIGLAGAGGG